MESAEALREHSMQSCELESGAVSCPLDPC